MKKADEILTQIGDALCRKYIFFIARSVQVDNIVNSLVPPGCRLGKPSSLVATFY